MWGVGTEENYIMAVTDSCVISFDTRALSPLWIVNRKERPIITVDPVSGLFAALDKLQCENFFVFFGDGMFMFRKFEVPTCS